MKKKTATKKKIQKKSATKKPASKKALRKKISAKRSQAKAAKKLAGPPQHHTPRILPNTNIDPAHSPGHRKLKRKDQFTDSSGVKTHLQKSAIENMSNSQKIRRTNVNRRIITGAAVGKTGRINYTKET